MRACQDTGIREIFLQLPRRSSLSIDFEFETGSVGIRNNGDHGDWRRSTPSAVGFDFGTTNSSVAVVDGAHRCGLPSFPSAGAETQSFRSVLYFEQYKNSEGAKRTHSLTGPAAIEHYLQTDEKGRLVQSLKSHLSSRTLTGTEVFGRRYKLEELISRMLSDLRKHTPAQFGKSHSLCHGGATGSLCGAETEDDQEFAVSRLRAAFALAGFEHVDFEMEPVAAAYTYEATLDHEELILIGDFGGGTSDFSLLRVGPEVRRRGRDSGGFAWQQRSGTGRRCLRRTHHSQACFTCAGVGLRSAISEQASACGSGVDLREPRALALPLIPAHEQRSRDSEERTHSSP